MNQTVTITSHAVASATPPRVVLADDCPEMLAYLRALLCSEVEVVAAVNNGWALIQSVGALRPELAVVDVSMPGLGGIPAVQRLKTWHPEVKVVFLSNHDEAFYREAAAAAGANGYVIKPRARTELLPAIRAALESGAAPGPAAPAPERVMRPVIALSSQ